MLCVTGHRPSGLPWGYNENDPRLSALQNRMRETLLRCVSGGVTHCITGMAQGVDTWFAELVLAYCPGVALTAAVPFAGQEKRWPAADQRQYHSILDRCTQVRVLAPWYNPRALLFRNEWMVDHSGQVMAVWDGSSGGTAHTVRYAQSLERVIHYLPPWDEEEVP